MTLNEALRAAMVSGTVLETIGNTPLVELRRVVPADCARIVVKVEGANPTGSMKDRVALSMIGRPEADGRLPSEGGKFTRQLFLDMIAAAQEMSRQPNTYWTDQLNNTDSVEGYIPMGEEIWTQAGGSVDAFVHAVGTSHSLRGVATALRRHKPSITIVAVEPGESPVLSGGRPGAHKIEGIGIGYAPPMWDPTLVDEVTPVPTADAEAMARRLAREEGLFAGTSSGANVSAAIQLGRRLGPGATVATLLVDSGLKYLSTEVFREH